MSSIFLQSKRAQRHSCQQRAAWRFLLGSLSDCVRVYGGKREGLNLHLSDTQVGELRDLLNQPKYKYKNIVILHVLYFMYAISGLTDWQLFQSGCSICVNGVSVTPDMS